MGPTIYSRIKTPNVGILLLQIDFEVEQFNHMVEPQGPIGSWLSHKL
jgi:hypothetical protein